MRLHTERVFGIRQKLIIELVVLGVAANGLVIIVGTLIDQLRVRDHSHVGDASFALPILIGLSLIYLSRPLSRRKIAAWAVTIPLYAFILALNISDFLLRSNAHHAHLSWSLLIRNILLPAVAVTALILCRKQFNVRSDLRNFGSALRFIGIIFIIAFLYGVVGFQLFDERDFHQQLSLPASAHYTIDQFGLTTNREIVPYTKRAHLFLDSLSIISVGAAVYAVISLFQPIKSRFADQPRNRSFMRSLLYAYPASSEDFFKLWPHDKGYFVNSDGTAALAFHVRRGVALCVGDPAGDRGYFDVLMREFDELCYVNDWSPAFVHTEPKFNAFYERHNFTLQKLGEEAVLDIDHFVSNVQNNKYFRNIRNRFEKAHYSAELLQPPHSSEIINRLHQVSNEWLGKPGRAERGFMMGYLSPSYLQQCSVLVARDENGVIQGFINQIFSFDDQEANFDMLRHTQDSLGNINDYLLVQFIGHVREQGFSRLNLGLSPLTGLDKIDDEEKTLIDTALRFAYANGDRLYSFSGLHRFKDKYEPHWSARYLAYRGGIAGFTRTVNALNGAMKIRFKS